MTLRDGRCSTSDTPRLEDHVDLFEKRADKALDIASQYGQIDGAHHKAWVIDQMVRALVGDAAAYRAWVEEYENDGAYVWNTGVAP